MPVVAEPQARGIASYTVTRTLARRVETDAEPTTLHDWAMRHRRIDERPFSLDHFRPLLTLYEDDHPHVVVIKPAQRGVSEWAINTTCFALERGATAWATGKDGLNVAYIFPTQDALRDFSKERLSGLKDESPRLRAMFEASDFEGVTFKQVGRSYLYLRGGWSEAALLSFAADVLILDEFDRMEPKAVALARRRLNASVVRREVDISTPTRSGEGVHALYLQSDRRVYEQPCPACSEWVSFDFFRDVRADAAEYAEWKGWGAERVRASAVSLHCPSCDAAWSDADRCMTGRWRARNPAITSLRGYHVPWWAFPFVDLTRFAVSAASANPVEVQEFHRSDLGLPFDEDGRRVFPGVTLVERDPIPTPDDLPPETITYRLPTASARYLIGADVAEGLAHGDRSCASVLLLDDIGRGSEAAHLCGTFEPELFALQLDALGLAYGGRLGVERNGPGVAVLQKLRSLVAERIARGDHQPYSLYHHVEPGRDPVQAGQVLPPAHLAGWRTTSASKPVLVQELGEALRTDLLHVHTPALLSELRAYQYDDFGRTSAPSGQHDDRVIAVGIAWAMRHAYTLIPRPAPRPIAYKQDGQDAVRDRLHRAFFGNVVAD